MESNTKPVNSQAFKFTVSLTRVADGKTVEFQDTWDFDGYVRTEDWASDHVYIWVDGNYACDCNRYLFFERALGGDPEILSHSCGDKEYKLNWLRNDETGEVFDPKETR